MIDFLNAISKNSKKEFIEPCELYDSLDRSSDAGPLRPSQKNVLNKWHNCFRDKNDIIIKLNTGSGKTLVGLLIALSYMNEEKQPSVYVCPNIYLFQQSCEEARKFGIPFCIFEEGKGMPEEFINAEKILITYVQKVFNGKTVFGLDNKSLKIGAFILDDSHACIDSISSASTITISRKSNKIAYEAILSIFEHDLEYQERGTYHEIVNNSTEDILMIPYWTWDKHIDNITSIISNLSLEDDNIMFPWQLLKNSLNKCDAFVSSDRIEISPECLPIKRFGSFSNAKHRIMMSATTQNDSFFIKNLGLSVEAVRNPIVDDEYTWSGEKMILIPYLMNSDLCDQMFIEELIKIPHKDFGVVVLTPSFDKSNKYSDTEAVIIDNKKRANIYDIIKRYKNDDYKNKYLVLANRYDGIDLPDNNCRLLVIDSLPHCETLNEKYEEECRINSDVINIKIAQKIEQALGRSVRGEKDYSVIIITGSSLINFLQSSNHRKFFSAQTRKQVEIGFDIINMTSDDTEIIDIKYIFGLIKKCVERDAGWKEYYRSQMDLLTETEEDVDILEILRSEKEAYDYFCLYDYENACRCMEKICNDYGNSKENIKNENEHSWYLQKLAKYKFYESELDSEKIQKRAFEKNQQLLKPKCGVKYKKITAAIDDERNKRLLNKLRSFKQTTDLKIYVEELLSNLSFGTKANTFEKTIDDLGELLGFIHQRPDQAIGQGPDNLWCISNKEYLSIECKSEVKTDRNYISKEEAGQVDMHFGWFRDEYKMDAFRNIIIIPTNRADKTVHFTHKVYVIEKNGLSRLVDDLRNMFSEYYKYDIQTIESDSIQEILQKHKFMGADFLDKYCSMIDTSY